MLDVSWGDGTRWGCDVEQKGGEKPDADKHYALLSNLAGFKVDATWLAGYHVAEMLSPLFRGQFSADIRCLVHNGGVFDKGMEVFFAERPREVSIQVTDAPAGKIEKCRKEAELGQVDVVFIGPTEEQCLTLSTALPPDGIFVMDITQADLRVIHAATTLFRDSSIWHPDWGFGAVYFVGRERNEKAPVRFLVRGLLPYVERPEQLTSALRQKKHDPEATMDRLIDLF